MYYIILHDYTVHPPSSGNVLMRILIWRTFTHVLACKYIRTYIHNYICTCTYNTYRQNDSLAVSLVLVHTYTIVAASLQDVVQPQLEDSDAALRYECRLHIGPAVRSSMQSCGPCVSDNSHPVKRKLWILLILLSVSYSLVYIEYKNISRSFGEHWAPLQLTTSR